MGKRSFALQKSDNVAKCPKCQNNKQFTAYSEQVCEDGCEIWVECYKCGFNPFAESFGSCIDSVMGDLDEPNISMALSEWTQLINETI